MTMSPHMFPPGRELKPLLKILTYDPQAYLLYAMTVLRMAHFCAPVFNIRCYDMKVRKRMYPC